MDIFGLFQSKSKFLNTFQVSLFALIILFDSAEQSQKLKIRIYFLNRIKILKSSRPYRLIEIPNFLFHRKDNFVIFIRRIVQVMALRPRNDRTAQFSSLLQSHLNSAVRQGEHEHFSDEFDTTTLLSSVLSLEVCISYLDIKVKYHHDDRAVPCNEASQQNLSLSCVSSGIRTGFKILSNRIP